MCLSDYALGRYFRTVETFFSLAAGVPTSIAAVNTNRVRIAFAPVGVSLVYIRAATMAVGAIGFGLNIGAGIVHFDMRESGDIVQREWFAFPAALGEDIMVWETFASEELLEGSRVALLKELPGL